jgi:hypothetical protein
MFRAAIRAAARRSVEQVFTLLAITHGRELMASALVGLISADSTLRGTALDTGLAPASERTTRELEEQLLLSTTGLISDSK